jgi:hypothetical protein
MEMLLRTREDAFLVPIPQYPLYSATLTLYGGQLVPYELDEEAGWGLNVDNLQVWVYAALPLRTAGACHGVWGVPKQWLGRWLACAADVETVLLVRSSGREPQLRKLAGVGCDKLLCHSSDKAVLGLFAGLLQLMWRRAAVSYTRVSPAAATACCFGVVGQAMFVFTVCVASHPHECVLMRYVVPVRAHVCRRSWQPRSSRGCVYAGWW